MLFGVLPCAVTPPAAAPPAPSAGTWSGGDVVVTGGIRFGAGSVVGCRGGFGGGGVALTRVLRRALGTVAFLTVSAVGIVCGWRWIAG